MSKVITVFYIGRDDSYISRIKKVFKKDYQALEVNLSQFIFGEATSPRKMFKKAYMDRPDIIYVDFSNNPEECLYFCKLINRNNEMRLISLVALFDLLTKDKFLERSISASVRINHIKSLEIHDVIYDPLSLLDVNMPQTPEFVRSKELDKFKLTQLLRVGFIEDNHFHIETNSYLEVGTIINIDTHPLEAIMPSKKVFVSKFYDRDLYYNKRFAYDLEFIYIDNDFFVATNERWKLYKDLKKNPEKINDLNDLEKDEITQDMEKRKKKYAPIKEEIDLWIKTRVNQNVPKKLKIMAIDSTLEIFDQLEDDHSFPYTLNVQSKLLNDFYQIKRSMPHLIVFHITEENPDSILSEVVEKIKHIEDYDPYILLFNTQLNTKEMRSNLNYPHLICYPNNIHLVDIKKMAYALDQKLHISDAKSKIFIHSSDPASTMYMSRDVKVLGMTESVLYLQAKTAIPMWTVFKVVEPIEMLLTVVPHKENGQLKDDNCYRCLINGVGELEKAEIRKMINKSFLVEE